MEKATIYDYARFTRAHCFVGDECASCPLKSLHCGIRYTGSEELTKINEIILNWCKEHPIKTRQNEFLKMFPNAQKLNTGILSICPKIVDETFDINCCNRPCSGCYKEYWLAEVEE